MGRVVGPEIPVIGFHGAAPVRRGLGMPRVIARNPSMSSSPCEMRAEAVVHAATEGQHGWRAAAGDVEAVIGTTPPEPLTRTDGRAGIE